MARCGSFAGSGLSVYTERSEILKVILNYDYLWINLRVKGGAYGCMSGIGRSGDGYFVSYRDPNLKETNEVYEGIPEYLENFQCGREGYDEIRDRHHQRAGCAADTILRREPGACPPIFPA